MPAQSELISLWYTALAEPLGLYIRTPDPIRLKSMLYSARYAAADPDLAGLQIRTSPSNPTGELWLVNPEGSADASAA